MNTNAVAALIEATTTSILDEWTTEAEAAGADVNGYIGDKLDELEETEPEVSMAVGKAFIARIFKAG